MTKHLPIVNDRPGRRMLLWTITLAVCVAAVVASPLEAMDGNVLVEDDFESYAPDDVLKAEWDVQRAGTESASVFVVSEPRQPNGQPNRALLVKDESDESNPVAALGIDRPDGEPLEVHFDWMVPEYDDQGASVLLGDRLGQRESAIALQLHISRNAKDGFKPWIGAYDGKATRYLMPFRPGTWYHVDIVLPRANEESAKAEIAITREGGEPQVFHGVALRNHDVPINRMAFLNNAPPDRTGNLLADNIRVAVHDPAVFALPSAELLRIPNGSFEIGKGAWETNDYYGPGLVTSRSDDATKGGYSLQITRPDRESTGWLDSPVLSWPTGEPVTIRFWMKGSPEVTGKPVKLELTGHQWTGQVRQSWPLTVTEEWKEYTVKARPLDKAAKGLRLRWRLPAGGWLRLDGVEVMAGEVAASAPAAERAEVGMEWVSGLPLVYADEPAVLRLRVGPMSSEHPPRVQGVLRDDTGHTVGLPPVRWTMDKGVAEALVDFGRRKIGLYEADLAVVDAQGKELGSESPRFAVIHRPAEASNWLAMFTSHYVEWSARMLEKLGIGTSRFGASEAWHVNEDQKAGQWRRYAGIKQSLRDHQIRNLAILQGAPQHLRRDTEQGNEPGRWSRALGLVWNDTYRKEWKDYVRHIAGSDSIYCGYEAWNETNAGSYFLGTTAALADMLVASREALTEAGIAKDHPVLGPTTSTIPQVYIRNVLAQVPAGTVDGVSIHPYRNGRGNPEDTAYPQELDALNDILREAGMPEGQVWASESGWISFETPLGKPDDEEIASTGPTESEAANYTIRGFVIGLSRGVDKQFYFLLRDMPGDKNDSRLGVCLNNEWASPKLGMLALSGMMARLNGAKFERIVSERPPFYAYQFRRGGEKLIVAWASHGKLSATVRASSADAASFDRFGRPLVWREDITLSEEPVYLEVPTDAELTLAPVVVPPAAPIVLRRDQPVETVLSLHGLPSGAVRGVTDGPAARGLWPLRVDGWKAGDNGLALKLSPGETDASGYGYGQLTVETAQGPRFVCLPVKFTTQGPAAEAKPLPVTADWKINSTDQVASLEDADGVARVTVTAKPKFYNHKWAGLTIPLAEGDLTGYDALEFDVETTAPTRDLAMGITLVAADGTRYTSWQEPDVLSESKGWQRVRIAMDSFRPGGLFRSYDKPAQAPLGEIGSVVIYAAGSSPQAQTRFELRDLQFVPSGPTGPSQE